MASGEITGRVSVLTRILILWLLAEGSAHGYRIRKILQEESLRFWFPVEQGSVYAVLDTLVRGGFVQAVAVEQEGRRPARTRYAITADGRRHLQELVRRAWLDLPGPSDALQAALAARSELADEEVAELAGRRAAALEDRIRHIDAVARSAPDPDMADRLRALAAVELTWVQGIVTRLAERVDGRR